MNNQELISRLRDAGQALETLARHLDSLEDIEITEDTGEDDKKENKKADKNEDKPKPNNNPFARLLDGAMSRPTANPFQLLSSLAGLGGDRSLIPGLASLSNIGNIGNLGGLGAISGISTQNLPTTLAELHDNPQLLAMLRGVANNPQMINMLSGITGQDSQTLLRALQSLQPQPAAQAHSEKSPAAGQPAEIPLIEAKTEDIAEAKAEAAQEAEAEAAPQTIAAFAADLAAKNFNNNTQSNTQVLNQIEQPLPTPAQTQAAAADIRMTNPANSVNPTDSYLDTLLAEWHWQPYARVWTL